MVRRLGSQQSGAPECQPAPRDPHRGTEHISQVKGPTLRRLCCTQEGEVRMEMGGSDSGNTKCTSGRVQDGKEQCEDNTEHTAPRPPGGCTPVHTISLVRAGRLCVQDGPGLQASPWRAGEEQAFWASEGPFRETPVVRLRGKAGECPCLTPRHRA